jgi:hypothetical protein
MRDPRGLTEEDVWDMAKLAASLTDPEPTTSEEERKWERLWDEWHAEQPVPLWLRRARQGYTRLVEARPLTPVEEHIADLLADLIVADIRGFPVTT